MSCDDPCRDRRKIPKLYKPKYCNPICKHMRPKRIILEKMMTRTCRDIPKPHPCDPDRICDPKKPPEGKCKVAICIDKIKHPIEPEHIRCTLGPTLPVKVCLPHDPPHPCDKKKPCRPGAKPTIYPCPVFVCKDKLKHPQPTIRAMKCPSPQDLISKPICENKDLFRAPALECPPRPCGPLPPEMPKGSVKPKPTSEIKYR